VNIASIGRVELDPFLVPAAARSSRVEPAFERALREAAAGEELRAVAPEPPPARPEELAPAAAPVDPPPPPAHASRPRREQEPRTDAVAASPQAAGRTEAAALAAPAARAEASAPAAAPGPRHAERAAAPTAAIQPQAAPVAAAGRAAAAPGHAAEPARSADAAGKAVAAAAEAQRHAPGARSTGAARAAAGYRSLNAHALRMDEAARDSVFRQILMKLSPASSEMRVLLEPRDLGALDLQMQVDASGATRLSITADRADLAALLDQHMPELARALTANGLTVAHAEVRSGGQRAQGDAGLARPSLDASTEPAEEAARAAEQRGGYIALDGLDFWV
jgi:hypothetical protein